MRRVLAALVMLAVAGGAALAEPARRQPAPVQPGLPAGDACGPAILAAERAERILAGLLRSIALVESGRPDPAGGGRAVPWPWTINAAGAGQHFASKEAAIAAVRALLASGVRSIDVGCAQVNLAHHPNAFESLDGAFDPVANLAYAARFLRSLQQATGSWPYAAAAYHSQTPAYGHAYAQRVMAAWPDAARHGPWPAAPAELPGGVRAAMPPARPDDSLYTPAFAARLRRMDEERVRPLASPAGPRGQGMGIRLPSAPVMLIPAPRPVATARGGAAAPAGSARTASLGSRRGT